MSVRDRDVKVVNVESTANAVLCFKAYNYV